MHLTQNNLSSGISAISNSPKNKNKSLYAIYIFERLSSRTGLLNIFEYISLFNNRTAREAPLDNWNSTKGSFNSFSEYFSSNSFILPSKPSFSIPKHFKILFFCELKKYILCFLIFFDIEVNSIKSFKSKNWNKQGLKF